MGGYKTGAPGFKRTLYAGIRRKRSGLGNRNKEYIK